MQVWNSRRTLSSVTYLHQLIWWSNKMLFPVTHTHTHTWCFWTRTVLFLMGLFLILSIQMFLSLHYIRLTTCKYYRPVDWIDFRGFFFLGGWVHIKPINCPDLWGNTLQRLQPKRKIICSYNTRYTKHYQKHYDLYKTNTDALTELLFFKVIYITHKKRKS